MTINRRPDTKLTEQRPAVRFDPDPLYVQPESVRRMRDAEIRDELRSGAVIAWLALALVVFVAAALVLWSLLSAASRGGPERESSPALLGTPPEAAVSPGPELDEPGRRTDGVPPPADVAGPRAVFLGTATWYCSATSPCTRGYGPSDMVAAIDTDLGFVKGDQVRVTYGDRSIVVTIVDVCACAGERLIDLTSGAFLELAGDLGWGVIPVTLEGPLGSNTTVPPTDVKETP